MTSNTPLVDDDLGALHFMGRVRSEPGELRFATSAEAALKIARKSAFDLNLLDAGRPGVSGFDVCKPLKAGPALAPAPVTFVTGHSAVSVEVARFDLGAASFIATPEKSPRMRARVRLHLHVRRLAGALRLVFATDALTAVANRPQVDASVHRGWRRARRKGDPLALLMIDADHFKAFPDHHRHTAGDACRRSVAQAIAGVGAPPADRVARHGNAGVGWAPVPGDSRVTDVISARGTPTALERAADTALYSAKRAGRARARFSTLQTSGQRKRARDIARCGIATRPADAKRRPNPNGRTNRPRLACPTAPAIPIPMPMPIPIP